MLNVLIISMISNRAYFHKFNNHLLQSSLKHLLGVVFGNKTGLVYVFN